MAGERLEIMLHRIISVGVFSQSERISDGHRIRDDRGVVLSSERESARPQAKRPLQGVEPDWGVEDRGCPSTRRGGHEDSAC